MALKEGVYENLINEELKKKIEEARQTDMVCKRDDIPLATTQAAFSRQDY